MVCKWNRKTTSDFSWKRNYGTTWGKIDEGVQKWTATYEYKWVAYLQELVEYVFLDKPYEFCSYKMFQPIK